MQYNTIRQYQEGGLRSRARRLLSGIDRGRKIKREQKFMAKDAKKLGLQRGLGSLFSTVGKIAGVPTFISDFLGNTAGDLLVKDPEFKSRTGYLQTGDRGYDALARVNRADKSGRLGRAIGAQAASTVGDFIKSGKLAEIGDDLKFKAKGALAKLKASRYSDPVTSDTGAVFSEASEMYGDVDIPDFDTSLPDTSGLTTQSDIDYLSSLDRASELGDKNLYEYSRQMSLPSSADAEMLGDVEVPSLIGGMIRSGELDAQGLPDVSGLPSKSEIDYISSLSRATETGSLNRALDMSQTAQSQAMQTSNQMEALINYLSPKPTVADFLQMRQRLMSGYAGGGLFNPMKAGRRIF